MVSRMSTGCARFSFLALSTLTALASGCAVPTGSEPTDTSTEELRSDGSRIQLSGGCVARNGSSIVFWSCGGLPDVWRFTADGDVVDPQSGLCLAVAGDDARDGVPLVLNACDGTARRRWALTGKSQLARLTGRCLDVRGASRANGTVVQLYGCKDGWNQVVWMDGWRARAQTIVGKGGFCLTGRGRDVFLWPCNGTGEQLWSYDVNQVIRHHGASSPRWLGIGSDGRRLELRDDVRTAYGWSLPTSGRISTSRQLPWPQGAQLLCLDIPNGDARQGQPVNAFPCNGGDNQLWHL